MMTKACLPGPPPVEILLRRSARARRFSLRVSQLDGRVTLSLPDWTREAEALAFIREKEGWIRAALARMPRGALVRPGGTILYAGQAVRLEPGPVRAPRLEGDVLLLPEGGRSAARVAAFLKLMARQHLHAACDRYTAALGRGHTGLVLRDPRSRWGSCTSDGKLMFSWRLVMAPPEVLDYVAAHEVAHLEEMNHAPAFWAVVARLMPDYARHQAWLRQHGAQLHGFVFED